MSADNQFNPFGQTPTPSQPAELNRMTDVQPDVQPDIQPLPTPIAPASNQPPVPPSSPVFPESTSPSNLPNNQLQAAAPQKKSKKGLWITLSVALGVLLLSGVGLLVWYLMYLNSDAKILSDAFFNSVRQTEASVKSTTDFKVAETSSIPEISGQLQFDSRVNQELAAFDLKASAQAGDYDVSGSANVVVDTENVDTYIRLNDLEESLKNLKLPDKQSQIYVDTFSDKWIKIPASLIDESTGQDNTSDKYQECLEKVSDKLVNDKAVQQNLFLAIKNSQFFVIERIGQDDDGIKFQLSINTDQTRDLLRNLIESQLYAETLNCAIKAGLGNLDNVNRQEFDEQIEEAADNLSDRLDELEDDCSGHLTFWISADQHNLTKVELAIKYQSDFELNSVINFDYAKVKIDLPSASTNIKDALSDFYSSLYSSDDYGFDYDYDEEDNFGFDLDLTDNRPTT
jgi:hypothetical protein